MARCQNLGCETPKHALLYQEGGELSGTVPVPGRTWDIRLNYQPEIYPSEMINTTSNIIDLLANPMLLCNLFTVYLTHRSGPHKVASSAKKRARNNC
jgi:hypothetical protein